MTWATFALEDPHALGNPTDRPESDDVAGSGRLQSTGTSEVPMDSAFPDAPLPRPDAVGIVLDERVGTTAAGELWTARPTTSAAPEPDPRLLVELLTRTIAADRAAIATGVELLWAADLENLVPPRGFVATDQGAALQLGLLPFDPTAQFAQDHTAGRQAARALAASVAGLHRTGRVHGSIGPAVLGRPDPSGPLQLAMTTTTALNGRAPADDVTALVDLVAPWLDTATANRARSHAILGSGIEALVAALDEPFTPSRGGGTARTVLPEGLWLALRSRRRAALAAVIGVAVAALLATGSVLSADRNTPAAAPPPLNTALNPLTSGQRATTHPGVASAQSFAFPEVQATGPAGVTARVQRTWRLSPSQPSLLLVEVAVEAPGTTGGTVAVGDALSPAVAPAATAVDTLGTPAQIGPTAPVQLHWDLMLGPNGQAVTTYTVHLDSPADDAASFASLVQSEQAVTDGLSLTVVTPSPTPSPSPAASSSPSPSPSPKVEPPTPAATTTPAAPDTAAASSAAVPPPGQTPAQPVDPAPSIVTGTISIPS